MTNLWNPDNTFFSMIRKLLYLMELSIIWVLLCLPVITIGPASAALYYSVVKAVRRERSYPVKEFFRAFRANLKRGMVITVLLLAAGIASGCADYIILLPCLRLEHLQDYLLVVLFIIKIYLFLGVLTHIFPLISRFETGTIKLVESALLLTVRHFFRTLLQIGLLLVVVLAVWAEESLLVIVPAVYYLTKSFLLEPIYQKYYAAQDLDGTNGIADAWYDNNAQDASDCS